MILLPFPDSYRTSKILDDYLLIDQQAICVHALENQEFEEVGFEDHPAALAAHLAYLSAAARSSALAAPVDARPYWSHWCHTRRKGTALGRPEWTSDPSYHRGCQEWLVWYRPDRYLQEFDISWPT